MKKNLILSFLLWLLAEIVFLLIFAFSGSVTAAAIFFAVLLITVASYLMCLFAGKNFSASVKLPATSKKSANAEGSLIISNSSPFTFIKIFCCISAKNNMTGDSEEIMLRNIRRFYWKQRDRGQGRKICSAFFSGKVGSIGKLFLLL